MLAIRASNAMLALPALVAAQSLTGIFTVTPEAIAVQNLTIIESEQVATSPFQVHSPDFTTLLGANPSLTVVFNATFPAFHEAGIVTSLDPLTFISSSNQFASPDATQATNNKTIVVSRTTFSNTTGQWSSDIIQSSTAPLVLANGGFQYQDGILFTAQGNLTSPSSAGLVYLPLTADQQPSVVINNFLGAPLNSPNDVYVSTDGVVYFTDPQIGFKQNIRPQPTLPDYVLGFAQGTTDVRVVADGIAYPNGLVLSPDEKTAYVTAAEAGLVPEGLSSSKSIYAFDIVSNGAGEVARFANKRVFAVPSSGIGDGIHCDETGNVWVGTGDGVSVYSPSGRLLGKILVEGGVANFGFASDGRLLVMAEKLLYLLQVDGAVQPAVKVGERRG